MYAMHLEAVFLKS